MKEEIIQVPLDKVDFRPQVREVFNEELIAGLAENIKKVGQLQPVLLFPIADRFGITDGQRRCLALKRLGRKTVDARIGEPPTEAQLLLRQLSCDLQRVDLSPMEKANAIDRAMEANGLTGNEIAAQLGVSPTTVSRLLSLLTLPDPIQQALKEGKISAAAAGELAKIEDCAFQAEMAQKLMEGKITRDGVAGARKAAKRGDKAQAVKRVTACLDGGRTITVAAATIDDFIAALEEALSKARKGRTQGVALATFIRLLKDQAA